MRGRPRLYKDSAIKPRSLSQIWGVGLGRQKAQDPKKWRGLNLLGKALMLVRAHLVKEDAEEAE